MKNKLLHSFRLRATMLVAMMLCVVNAAWAQSTYTKVTSTPSDWSGTYVIVADASNVIFTGKSGSNNYGGYTSVTISNNSVTGNFSEYEVEVEASGDYYSIKHINSSNYLGWTSGNYLYFSTSTPDADSYRWKLSTSSILNANDESRKLQYNSGSPRFACYTSSQKVAYLYKKESSSSSAVATTTTIVATGITNTDVYTSTAAGSLAATVTAGGNAVDGATVTWSGNNDNVATIDEETGEVTLVAAGSVTFTATYAGVANTYQSSTATYDMTVTSSAPYVQPTTVEITPNYTFWGKTDQFSGSTFSELSGSKDNVSLSWTRGSGSTYASTTAMRFYKDNTLTFTAPSGYEIKSIQLAMTQSQSDLSFSSGSYSSSTWTGSSQTVTMSRPSNASSYAQITTFTITLAAESTDPSITASDVNIAYNATGGSFDYTINNPVQDGVVSVDFDSEGDWLLTATDNNGTVSFTCTANATNAEREAVVQIIYTYNNDVSVTKEVLITQAAAPVIYTTIPALFDAATNTETDVTVTFGGWVVSAVKNANAYLTDNQGNGLIIYASSHGFQVNDVLTGTVSCKLVLYRGSAELTNLTTSTEGLTVTSGGTVTAQTIAISDLGGVNTGALLSFEGLTYNGTALVDGDNNAITPYNTLYSEMSFENTKSYDVTGIYLQYNTTKEILPRSAADIEEVVSSEPSITVAQTTVNVTATDDNGTIGITYANLSINDMNDFGIQYCDAQGNELSQGSEPTWIVVEVAEDNNDYVVSYIMNENTSSEARSAYFKVFAMGDADFVYSDLITVTQAGVVVDYATLPFIWAGGSNSGLSSTNGVTIEGAGTDYSANTHAPYLIKFDSDGDYIQVKTNAQPGIAFISVKMIGGGTTSTITVQESADGSDFEDVEALTISGKQNDILELGTTTAFAATTRYVRFAFTRGSNVGVGPITITKPLKLNASGYATIASTSALDFSTANYTAWVVTSVDGETINFSNVTEAPANTGLLLKGTEDNAVTLSKTDNAADIATNLLEAITTATAITAGQYFGLKDNEFVPVNAGTVPAGKALLPASEVPNNVKSFTFVFNGADGIQTVETVSAEDAKAIFNLAGQRLSKTQRGVNIVNGKKVLVK